MGSEYVSDDGERVFDSREDYEVDVIKEAEPDEERSKGDVRVGGVGRGSDLYKAGFDDLMVPLDAYVGFKDGINPREIGKIVSEGSARRNSESYMDVNFCGLARLITDYRNGVDEDRGEALIRALENKVVVDLGAGKSYCGYLLAQLGGAKSYVGVEPNYAHDLKRVIKEGDIRTHIDKRVWEGLKEMPLIPYSVADTDMLSFMRGIEDEQVSIIAAGIDDSVIHDGKYEGGVRGEIERVMARDGGLVSVYSEIFFKGDGIEKVEISGNGSYVGNGSYLFRRKGG